MSGGAETTPQDSEVAPAEGALSLDILSGATESLTDAVAGDTDAGQSAAPLDILSGATESLTDAVTGRPDADESPAPLDVPSGETESLNDAVTEGPTADESAASLDILSGATESLNNAVAGETDADESAAPLDAPSGAAESLTDGVPAEPDGDESAARLDVPSGETESLNDAVTAETDGDPVAAPLDILSGATESLTDAVSGAPDGDESAAPLDILPGATESLADAVTGDEVTEPVDGPAAVTGDGCDGEVVGSDSAAVPESDPHPPPDLSMSDVVAEAIAGTDREDAPGSEPTNEDASEVADNALAGVPPLESHELPLDGLSVTDELPATPGRRPAPPTSPRTGNGPRRPRPVVPGRRRATLVYHSPRWRVPDTSTPEIQQLKAKAMDLGPLQVSNDRFEELRYLVTQERKAIASGHQYREGQKYNTVVAHVDSCFLRSRKLDLQREEQEAVRDAEARHKAELEQFDSETVRFEKQLLERRREQREAILRSHQGDMDVFEEHWKSPAKFRMYNRASNRLTILRRQLAFLLVQCRFTDAEEVRKLVDRVTKAEEYDNHRLMQRDHDVAHAILDTKQKDELDTFDQRALIQLQKFQQDRAVTRKLYENRGRKLAARGEIASDADRLWNHQQSKRIVETVARSTHPAVPSTKMTRADIKDRDVAILNLPPLSARRKNTTNKAETRALMRDTGHRLELDLNPRATVAEVKQTASNLAGTYVHTLKANRRLLHDNELIGECRLMQDCVIFVNPQAMPSSAPLPVARPKPVLPPRTVGWSKETIDARLTTLHELGFEPDKCKRALYAAGCNIDRAAEYLVAGNIPEFAVEVAASTICG